MSIISCQACGKKISDKAAVCEHCGARLGEVSAEQGAILQQRKLRDEIYRWKLASYALITLFIAGFGWYWWASDGYSKATSGEPFYLMVGAGLAYAAVRVYLYLAKRKLKHMRQGAY